MIEEHYFTRKPSSSHEKIGFTARLRGNELVFLSSSGVFSKKKADLGSRVLIENCQVADNQKVLDLGCSIGVVGLSIAREFPSCAIFMTDINERAVGLAKQNAKANGIANVTILQGSVFAPVKNEKFDVILLNPPQTAGKKLCFEMIEQSRKHLNKDGSLQLVARHQKGGRTLESKMEEVFGNVSVLAKSGGYRVYISKLL
ncbi:class I SAM-dependent methyltransferase [Candidatus Woesearchaeota archaeon]|nr:class I SAM-dependent methyltransferase [Candidatus Woesearchaeota archaeon]